MLYHSFFYPMIYCFTPFFSLLVLENSYVYYVIFGIMRCFYPFLYQFSLLIGDSPDAA